MALTIEGATVGYDVNGMQDLINEVNTGCVVPACASLRKDVGMVRSTIDSVWVGASAEAFKTKLSNDTEDMCRTLTEVGDQIREQLNNAGSNVEQYDSDLAEQIKNW